MATALTIVAHSFPLHPPPVHASTARSDKSVCRPPWSNALSTFQSGSVQSLERGRSIHPQQPRLLAAGIFPAMRSRALKVKTVSRLKPVFLAVQSNGKLSAQDIDKLFAFVRVRVAALRRRRHTK